MERTGLTVRTPARKRRHRRRRRMARRRLLVHRARADHAGVPDAIFIIGITERDRVHNPPGDDRAAATESRPRMHYFDSRHGFRVYDASVDDQVRRYWGDARGFLQRFTGGFADACHDPMAGTRSQR